MKLDIPVEVDLLEFFKTARFDFLKLGQTKEWVINNFPDPDNDAHHDANYPIWNYGDIELHFHDDNSLFLIYCDYIQTLDGGKSVHLNKWIFNEPEKLTMEYVIHHLNKERIGFRVQHGTQSTGFVSSSVELLPSHVRLSFSPTEDECEDLESYLLRCKTEDSNKFTLDSFSLMAVE